MHPIEKAVLLPENTINAQFYEKKKNNIADYWEDKKYKRSQKKNNIDDLSDESEESLKRKNIWTDNKLLLTSTIVLFAVLISLIAILIKLLLGGAVNENKKSAATIDPRQIKENPSSVTLSDNDIVTITLLGKGNRKLDPKNFNISQELIKDDSTIRMVFNPAQTKILLRIYDNKNYQDTIFRIGRTPPNISLVLREKKDPAQTPLDNLRKLLQQLNQFEFRVKDLENNSNFYTSIFNEIENAGGWEKIKSVTNHVEGFYTVEAIKQCIDNNRKLCRMLYSTKVISRKMLKQCFTDLYNKTPTTLAVQRDILNKWIQKENIYPYIYSFSKKNMTVSEIMKKAEAQSKLK